MFMIIRSKIVKTLPINQLIKYTKVVYTILYIYIYIYITYLYTHTHTHTHTHMYSNMFVYVYIYACVIYVYVYIYIYIYVHGGWMCDIVSLNRNTNFFQHSLFTR